MRRLAIIVLSAVPAVAQTAIPRTWDDAAIKSALLPPPAPGVRIEHIPSTYYERMRERVLYRRYPVACSYPRDLRGRYDLLPLRCMPARSA
jgi:hypothetical protein